MNVTRCFSDVTPPGGIFILYLFVPTKLVFQLAGVRRKRSMCQNDQYPGGASSLSSLSAHRIRRSTGTAQPWTLVRLGKLHVGVHGLLGLASLILTSAALVVYRNRVDGERPSSSSSSATRLPNQHVCCCILALSQLCNAILVQHAKTLLPQVPAFTQIVPGVVAPHKEAFRRTIAVVQYLIARACLRWIRIHGWLLLSSQSRPDYLDYGLLAILIWHWWPLVPDCFHLEPWLNGNTWIFVVPIFVGVTGDLYQYIFWGDCVSIANLLTGQLLGLCLAFGFTLGFRHYLPMPIVYGLAAVAVWCIIQEGIVTIRECAIIP